MEIITILFWVICGLVSGVIAENKGRNAGVGFLLGVLLGPIGLLIVALMPPPAVTFASTENVIYSAGDLHITNQRLLVDNLKAEIKELKPVEVRKIKADRWQIDLFYKSGKRFYYLISDNEERVKKIARSINEGIQAPYIYEADALLITSNAEKLMDLKTMLDTGLITLDEFSKKKAEILSKM